MSNYCQNLTSSRTDLELRETNPQLLTESQNDDPKELMEVTSIHPSAGALKYLSLTFSTKEGKSDTIVYTE